MAAYTRWRLLITETGGQTTNSLIANIELLDAGGTNLCPAATKTFSSQYGIFGQWGSNAFDSDPSSTWGTQSGLPGWVELVWPEPVDLKTLVLRPGLGITNQTSGAPSKFKVQYYDNAAWHDAFNVFPQGYWTQTTQRTFPFTTKSLASFTNNRAWRVRVPADGFFDGFPYVQWAEVQFRGVKDGPDLCEGGDPWGMCADIGWPHYIVGPERAFDGSSSTWVRLLSGGAYSGEVAIGYQFAYGEAPVLVQILLQTSANHPNGFTSAGPRYFIVDRWNGTAWVPYWTSPQQEPWSPLEIRIFNLTQPVYIRPARFMLAR